MADNTRLKDLQTEMRKAFEAIQLQDQQGVVLGGRLNKVETHLSTMQLSLTQISTSLERLVSSSPNGGSNSSPMSVPRSSIVPPLQMRQTPDHDRLTIASVHFEGLVIPWFQMLHRTKQLSTWFALATAVETQFGPSPFDSARSRLFKLPQSGFVADYYNEFMMLANRSEELSEAALLDCFISGLHDSIRRDVLAQSPSTLVRAVSLARLFDEKATLGLSVQRPKSTASSFGKPVFTPSNPSSSGSHSRATIFSHGFLAGKPIRVLLDGGSSDSFIQPRLAQLLHLPVQPSSHVKVMVGDGFCITAEGFVSDLTISIDGHTITFPVYVLAVSGAEVVMGASWVRLHLLLGMLISTIFAEFLKLIRLQSYIC
ncbi:Retrotransposon gag domain [Sesbania bispinosa]|nr:Retrotransposon gag domain [Sesbania bispinosa]